MVAKSLIVSMALSQAQIDQCAVNLVRKAQTLTYTCELETTVQSKPVKFQQLTSPASLSGSHGGIQRQVQVEVSLDGKVLSLTTAFDATGLDLEVSKFNDDFFAVYNQAAHSVISDAMRNQTIKFKVAEEPRK